MTLEHGSSCHVPLPQDEENGPRAPTSTSAADCKPAWPEYTQTKRRHATYYDTNWSGPPPGMMAAAGFFKSKEGCVCFYCSLYLKGWNHEMIPWAVHTYHNPRCCHVVRNVEPEYITYIMQYGNPNRVPTGRKDAGTNTDDSLTAVTRPIVPIPDHSLAHYERLLVEDLCIICLDKRRTHASRLCGHLLLCLECSMKCNSCPMCRGKAEPFIRIFR